MPDEMQPIPYKHKTPAPWEITDKPVPAPEIEKHFSKWDYACMGARRALKAALYGSGAAIVLSGLGMLVGLGFLETLKGSAAIVAGSSLMMGSGKIYEEKQKADGKTPTTEKIITLIITAIVTAVMTFLNAKKKGGQK